MKTIIASALGACLLLSHQATPVFAASSPVTVAIFDFESKDESARDLGPKFASLLNALMSAENDLVLVERAELEKALGEQELGASGTVSQATAAKIGTLTGAKVIVTGKIFKADKDLIAVSKVIGVETSRVYGETARRPAAGNPIAELSEELAKKIGRQISEKRDTLVASSTDKQERLDQVIKKLKEGKRPAVSLQIPEQHFGVRVADPAAQTELAMVLQRAGFTIVDDKSSQKPDIELTGEAFSAAGPRKGNLVSCKARVELKARDRATGNILLVDRQTSVAVDLTEQTAAKLALENAATELSERLLPQLVNR